MDPQPHRLQTASERIALIQAFAVRLVSLRQRAGLSSSELAERSRVSPAVIAKAERARAEPRLSLILALCEGLAISPTELLKGLHAPGKHRAGDAPRASRRRPRS